MIRMKKILAGILLISTTNLTAQDSAKQSSSPNPLLFSGYTEVFYQYDFNKPADNNRPGFIYSHNRHNEFNLNLGFLKGSYNGERVRANLALAAGTYMNANYAAETGVFTAIQPSARIRSPFLLVRVIPLMADMLRIAEPIRQICLVNILMKQATLHLQV